MVIVAKFEVENVLLQREMRISLEEKPTEMEKKIIKQKKNPWSRSIDRIVARSICVWPSIKSTLLMRYIILHKIVFVDNSTDILTKVVTGVKFKLYLDLITMYLSTFNSLSVFGTYDLWAYMGVA